MGVRRFAPAVVTASLVIAVVLASSVLGEGKALGAVTTVSVLSSDVSVRHGASAVYVAAIDGEVLDAGDAIRTGDTGRAILTYFEGSSVTIEPGTELTIDVAATHGGDTIVQMTQAVGRSWHVVTKLITGGSRYEVRTPASTASVRGTEFEVLSDATATTVTTTEGTVMDQVLDPALPGRVVEVPVTAGTTHTQPRNAPPTQPRQAPQPERTVTVTVDASNSLIVDPQGRANGIRSDGKLVVQTPGARVKRERGRIVITLPEVSDGRLVTRVDRDEHSAGRVNVLTRITDADGTIELDDDADDGDLRTATSVVELKRGRSGVEARLVTGSQKDRATASPGRTARPAATRTPEPTLGRTPSPSPRSEREPTETPKPRG